MIRFSSGISFTFTLAFFYVYLLTFIIIRKKNAPIVTSDILWGVAGSVALTIFWEIIIQGTGRYLHNHVYFVQWDQVLADILGTLVAATPWLIKRKKYLNSKLNDTNQ